MLRRKKKYILIWLFVVIFFKANYLSAIDDYLSDLKQRDLTPYNEKLRTNTDFNSLPKIKNTAPSSLDFPDPSKYKSPQQIKETRIKPSYGREKEEKPKKEIKMPELKIDPNTIHYIEIVFLVLLVMFFIRKEMRKIRNKELRKDKNDSEMYNLRRNKY